MTRPEMPNLRCSRSFAPTALERLAAAAAFLLVATLVATDCLAAAAAAPPPSSPAYVLVFRGGAQLRVSEPPVFSDGRVTYRLPDGKPGISSEKSIDREATERLNRQAAEKSAALAAAALSPSAADASSSTAAAAGVSDAKRKAAIRALESRSGTGDSATAAQEAKARDEGAVHDVYRESVGHKNEDWARRAPALEAALAAAQNEFNRAERLVQDLEHMQSAGTYGLSVSPDQTSRLREAQDAADRARGNLENAQRDYDNLRN